MRRPGWNPTRRNRKIGTEDQGWRKQNRLVIPSCWGADWRDDRPFWERLNNPIRVPLTVHGSPIQIIVEETRADTLHAATVDDVVEVLRHVPPDDMAGLQQFVLRQPTRKEQILSGCWGRMAYHCAHLTPDHDGPAVFLEAGRPKGRFTWPTRQSLDSQKELDRLRADGHTISTGRRAHVIEFTLETVRATQLYRTLLHEIGHWRDFLEKVERPYEQRPESDHGGWGRLYDAYFARPGQEREAYAHRYADTLRQTLFDRGVLPFDRKYDPERIDRLGLRRADFAAV